MTRDEAIRRIKAHKAIHKMDEPRAIYISEALDMAIEALEQPYGKWYSYTRFRMNSWEGGYGCTCCKEWSAKKSNYCPNCGADMRGEENDKE